MSLPINITGTTSGIPYEYNSSLQSGSISARTSTTSGVTSGLNPASNTSAYALFTGTTQNSDGYAYYDFNITGIPSNATITSVSASARGRAQSNNRGTFGFQLCTNASDLKGSEVTGNSTTSSAYTLTTGTNWSVSDISNLKLRIRLRRTAGNTFGFRFYGATVIVNYSVNGVAYEVNITNNSSVSVDKTYESAITGDNVSLVISGVEDLGDITVTDNGTDVTDQLVVVPSGGDEATSVLGTYALISGTFSSDAESYFQGIVGNGVDATQTTTNYYSSNSGVVARFSYDFNITGIPSNATITRVYCEVNGHAESTSSDNEYMTAQLILNTSANTISDELNFKNVGTSNTTQTVEATTLPSLSEISGLKLLCGLGYYGGAINGATCHVVYSTPQTGALDYTYTISNISADHTIVVDDAGTYTSYNVNASSSYNGATVSPSTQSIREGRSANVQISVNNLYEIVVKDNGTVVTSSLVQNATGYTYTVSNVQAVHNIVVEEGTYYTVTASSTYTGATATATPTKVYAGQDSVVEIDVDNLYEIRVKDNNVDVTSSVVESQGSSTNATFTPSEYVASASSYVSVYNGNEVSNGVNSDHTSTTRTCVYSNTGSGVESRLTYKFDCSSIPENATITSVACSAKTSVYQTTYFSTRNVQLYHGDTAKGTATQITATGSNGTSHSINGGSWTRAELDDISVVVLVTRSASSPTADASFSFWGATLRVDYTTPDGCFYTLTNVQGDHTVVVEEAPYFSITTSSTYANASASVSPAHIYQGQNATITLSVQNLYEVTVKLDGTDITNNFAGSNGTYTYTLQNVTANHTLAIEEAPHYTVTASSKVNGATISPSSQKVYAGQTAVVTLGGSLSGIILKDNNVDVTSSISNGTYTIANISADHNVVIFMEADYVKVNGTFKQVRKYYKKINEEWTEITSAAFNSAIEDTILVYGGQQTGTTVIGEVVKSGSTVEILINDNALQSGSYKFVYEDETKTPLENVDEIKEFTIS